MRSAAERGRRHTSLRLLSAGDRSIRARRSDGFAGSEDRRGRAAVRSRDREPVRAAGGARAEHAADVGRLQEALDAATTAHAADVALGIPGARDNDDELTKARAALNWERHFELSFDPDLARALHDEDLDVDTDFCAMCGHDWCSVRISKQIQEFTSGKDPEYFVNTAKVTEALTPDQQTILEQRGVLSPSEVHRLASKTRGKMGASVGEKAICHSDIADDDRAQAFQDSSP